jgi:hypothetical protein
MNSDCFIELNNYRLDSWGSILCKGKDLSHHNHVKTGSEAHSASSPVGPRDCFFWSKRLHHKAIHGLVLRYKNNFIFSLFEK